ncbi:trypsin-like peptidase domain-containing protein [Rhizobium hidalgonense]|uniref:trypsin-like peptidase domain-containing protein n=1 Tax=Rhizobium hidalgonense TaxID=1538159 RepID=UPI0028725D08|nr:trypsin-like peptidase domain-containing protein [Rhizobium hidalgonense]MDR9811897.1 trypsin-like peptidase domain-containing protein [Rhizobium hidalgonense]
MRTIEPAPRISQFSSTVCPLTMQRLDDDDNVLASAVGSGFFWRRTGGILTRRKGLYLITNWHNVTGTNPETGRMMGQFIPNALVLKVRRISRRDGGMTYTKLWDVSVPLYSKEVPVWFEHPTGAKVDCVAIPILIDDIDSYAIKPLNECDLQADLMPDIGMDCFVIGYPKGLSGAGATPVWKRASIATEPSFDHDKKPIVLVDTATREGMSGSPVIIRHSGIHAPGGTFDDNAVIGTVENFLGVYSGRIGDDAFGVQLGRVWKARVVDEILDGGVVGRHPNES